MVNSLMEVLEELVCGRQYSTLSSLPYLLICVCVCISQALHEEETELQANQKVLVRDEQIGRMAIDVEATQAQMNHAIRHATQQNSIMDRVLWAALFRAFPWTLGIHGTQVVCMLDVKWFSLIPAGWRPDKLPAHRYHSAVQSIPYPTPPSSITPLDTGQFKSISNGYERKQKWYGIFAVYVTINRNHSRMHACLTGPIV